MKKKRVVVGMSGGVDSSVAAWLLKEQGYDVTGVTMQIWQEDEKTRETESGFRGNAVEDARRAAQEIGIPHYVMNFREEFKTSVIDYFIRSYLEGKTPNPCIACNRYVKWEALLKRSLEIGADYIATGHYASVGRLENGRLSLHMAVSDRKDQTYALYSLTQEQLARTKMPLGSYSKEEVRAMAERLGLRVADKPDSQDICFVPDGDYAAYIRRHTREEIRPGNFVLTDGTVIGQHKGIVHYTVGQRKGLGLAMGYPVFVLGIRPDTNEVVVGPKEQAEAYQVRAENLHFMSVPGLEGKKRVWAKIRYNHKGGWCTAERTGPDALLCTFEEPVRGVTPGQAVVLYHEGYVLGGGTIL